MFLFHLAISLGLAADSMETPIARLRLWPLETQQAFLSSVNQMESHAGQIYLRDAREGAIFVLDDHFRLLRTLGGKGQGPLELGSGPVAMSAGPRGLWVVGGDMSRAKLFQGNRLVDEIRTRSYQRLNLFFTSAAFASSENHILMAAEPKSGALAIAYGRDGSSMDVGRVTDLGFRGSMRLVSNDTLWITDGAFWYGVYKYMPLIVKLDQGFREVARFRS